MSKSVACLFVIALQGAAGLDRQTQGLRSTAKGFVRALEFQHHLRVCNAYPYAAPLDVYQGKNKLTASALPYKSCEQFKAPLKAGDKLEFRVGDSSAGTFSVSDLPNNDAVLLLMIHRHDTLSTAVSFESHVFANLLNAQVAVIDTYKGAEKASLKIQDKADSKTARQEELRYDSVVAVNPGEYEVALVSSDSKTLGKATLTALNRESYVVMRVGVEAQQGQAYPQELVVYPSSDPAMLRGAAHVGTASSLAALAVFAGLCMQ
jgi:hypothetical protein